MNVITEYLHHELTFTDKAAIIHVRGEPFLWRCHLWSAADCRCSKRWENQRQGNKIIAGFLTALGLSHWLERTLNTFVLTATQSIRGLEVHYSQMWEIQHGSERVRISLTHVVHWQTPGIAMETDPGNEGLKWHDDCSCLWLSLLWNYKKD